MRSFRDLPIERKLTASAMLSSGVALLLACAAFVAYERSSYGDELLRDLNTTARMVGDNSAAALSFGDQASAELTLKTLSAKSHIVGAAIYDRDGQLFGTYHRSDAAEGTNFEPPPLPTGVTGFRGDSLEVFHLIVVAGEKAGTLYVRASLDEMQAKMWRFVLITLGVLGVAGAIAFVMSTRLQRLVVSPITHLSRTAVAVAQHQDYSVRATKQSNDELGQLVEAFNNMLTQIQLRDAELQASRESLEHRVTERTRELRAEVAERTRSEAALKDSEERFSSAFENASIGMALVAPEGHWLKVNRALCELVGYTSAELLARTFQDITYPEDLPADLLAIRQFLAGDIASYQSEKRYLHKLGHTVWVQLSVSLVHDAQARPLHFIAQIQNISERKKAETELQAAHQQLLETSRLSGMAEIASNVLHNVGNTLNSVNVSAGLVTDRLKKSKVAGLAKAVGLMKEHEPDIAAFMATDPRGRQLPTYLTQVLAHIQADQDESARELQSLRGNIDHIKEIVAMQQRYARVGGLEEKVAVTGLVEDALRMNAEALSRHGVEVIREFHEVPPMHAEKHKILQILMNLFANAKHACDDSGRPDKRLTVRIVRVDGRVRIEVTDNGVGIPPENLTRIFGHGFTTRKAGHGFGLHSGALAAKSMGGSLTARSEGPGKGATFTLELPWRAQESGDG